MAGDRIEQRLRLRAEPPLSEAAILVRGGPDTRDKLARHAHRTARFATYRTIHMPTAARLLDCGFELLPTGLRPHYTIRLRQADNAELGELLAALGPPVANLQYAGSTIWREEGP